LDEKNILGLQILDKVILTAKYSIGLREAYNGQAETSRSGNRSSTGRKGEIYGG
jgi:hypothetical protein